MCGMQVDRAKAITRETAGGRMYFCSDHCAAGSTPPTPIPATDQAAAIASGAVSAGWAPADAPSSSAWTISTGTWQWLSA